MKVKLGRRTLEAGAAGVIVIGLLVVAAVTALGITGWEYSNSNSFCTNVCHSVHPEEPKAHAASFHARVNCVECHMGRLSTLHLMALKPTHVNELWGMLVGYDRPTVSHSLRPARESCEACHWPQARHADTLRVRYRYADDAKSTETRYNLQLHTGSGEARGALVNDYESGAGMAVRKGIHWHVAQEIQYAATDPQHQNIVLVEVHGTDGKVVGTYFDPTKGVSRADADKLPKRRMDCIDCHNASGHPFPNPADLVDEALAEQRIDRSLPSIKARSNAIIAKAAGVVGPENERAAKFKTIIDDAAPKPVNPKTQDAEAKFAAEMQRLLLLTSFQSDHAQKPLTWKTFPNDVGHKDAPGCFRCHDGKHQNEKGQAVRLQCTLCHGVPQVVREDGARTVASTVVPDMTPPDFHSDPNFMHEHRFKVDDSCAACHGPPKWGKDGGNFCANPACHGRQWPELNLNVEAPKPASADGSPVKPATVADKKSSAKK